MRLKNKKAGFYALLLVMITLILVAYTMHSFVTSKNRVVTGIKAPNEILSFNQEIDRDLIYERENIRNSVFQSFYEVSQENMVEPSKDCNTISHNGKEYIIFGSECVPDKEYTKEKFLEKLNDENHFFSLEQAEQGNILVVSAEPQEKQLSLKKPYASYILTYDVDPSFSIILEEEGIVFEDFIKIYSEAERCKTKEDVVSCLNVERWKGSFEESSYKFFVFKTEKYYFYEIQEQKVFAPVEFRFALE